MRRSLRLVAALAWLLELGACGDQPPARAADARVTRPPQLAKSRGKRPSSTGAGGVRHERESGEAAKSGPAREARLDHQPSLEELARRYSGARALSVQRGSASYYSDKFAGRSTASGAPYEPRGYTAAHRNLPFGSVLRITRQDGGQTVYVRVTDRGPYARGRVVDLSRAAAEQLGMLRAGVVTIKLEVVEYGPARKPRRRRR
jgi:rare lipoprotein A (peptidoglycan hydrolase)